MPIKMYLILQVDARIIIREIWGAYADVYPLRLYLPQQ